MSYLSAFKAKFSLLLETAKIKSDINSFFIISLHKRVKMNRMRITGSKTNEK